MIYNYDLEAAIAGALSASRDETGKVVDEQAALKLSVLRMMKTAVQEELKSPKHKGSRTELDENETLQIFYKAMKTRRKAAGMYRDMGATVNEQKEYAEIAVLEAVLKEIEPDLPTKDEISAFITEKYPEFGGNIGLYIKKVKELWPKADTSDIADMVKAMGSGPVPGKTQGDWEMQG